MNFHTGPYGPMDAHKFSEQIGFLQDRYSCVNYVWSIQSIRMIVQRIQKGIIYREEDKGFFG